MKKILTKNLNTGIQEEIKIKKTPPNEKANQLTHFFDDSNKLEIITEQIMTGEIKTTQELNNLKIIINTTIKTQEFREDFNNYIDSVKNGEKGLLDFFTEKGLLNNGTTKVEINFTGDFGKLGENFIPNFDNFVANKAYKASEFNKVTDENGKYKIIFFIGYTKEKVPKAFIEDFIIE